MVRRDRDPISASRRRRQLDGEKSDREIENGDKVYATHDTLAIEAHTRHVTKSRTRFEVD